MNIFIDSFTLLGLLWGIFLYFSHGIFVNNILLVLNVVLLFVSGLMDDHLANKF